MTHGRTRERASVPIRKLYQISRFATWRSRQATVSGLNSLTRIALPVCREQNGGGREGSEIPLDVCLLLIERLEQLLRRLGVLLREHVVALPHSIPGLRMNL